MASSEAARNDLYNGLIDLLGPERAEALMTHLPDYDPTEVATKSDFSEFRGEMKAEFSEFRREMNERLKALEERMNRILLTLIVGLFVVVASVVGLIGVVLAAL